MYACMYVCMYVCIPRYVYIYIYIHAHNYIEHVLHGVGEGFRPEGILFQQEFLPRGSAVAPSGELPPPTNRL